MILPRTLLVATAHPDDESMGPGGTIARYAAEGARVVLVCATRGEAGKPGDPPLCSRDELPRVRTAELRQAAAVLGIAEVHCLGYPDGCLAEADETEAAAAVASHILAAGAEVVVTLPPGGISGHRDHRAICRFTELAFHQARQAGRGRPERLYYWTLRPERFGPGFDLAPVHPLDRAVTAEIDVAAFVETKIAAIRCHRTQHLSWERVFRGFPADVRQALGRETFYRAFPPVGPVAAAPAPDTAVEDSLWP